MKKWWIVFRTESGKELAAYTAAGTFLGEAENTKVLLAYQHGLKPEEIRITSEKR